MRKQKTTLIFLLVLVLISLNCVNAAHYIIGYVNDALDGTTANDRMVVLWNPLIGKSDNLTDIIGENGNSGYPNYYMIDCEMLSTPCSIGDTLSIEVIDNGSAYVSRNVVNVTVSEYGFDFADDLFINSPPRAIFIKIDDIFDEPKKEIDLLIGGKTKVWCNTTITDYDGINEVTFEKTSFFYYQKNFNDSDAKRNHYTNESCKIKNESANEIEIDCTFELEYYANPGEWICSFLVRDFSKKDVYLSDNTTINEILAIETADEIRYSFLYQNRISEEKIINISNKGNIEINLTIEGYGKNPNDNLSFFCSSGQNISINNHKYNLTNSNPGEISLNDFLNNYLNLTSEKKIKKFDLSPRTNDIYDNSIKPIFWRVFVPETSGTSCQGRIIIGAIKSPED